MEAYKASRYTLTIPLRDGRSLAYNGLSGAFAVWSREERAAYEGVPAGTGEVSPELTALEHGGYVVPEDVDELGALKSLYDSQRFRRDLMTLTIAPTMACNFGCDYCFQGADKPSETMTPEVQDTLIAMIERVAPAIKMLGVAWYGGEPLLRRKVIESLSDRILAVCDRRGIKYEASIVTNGYLLDVEAAQSLRDRRVSMAQVTLDGAPEDHDGRRHLLSGKGTFDRILGNLKAVAAAVPSLSLAIRVNIDERNGGAIHALLDQLAAMGLGGRKNVKVYFAPVEAMTQGCHEVEDVCLSKSRYGALEADLHRKGYALGLTSAPYPPRFHGTCAAVRPRGLVVIANGDIHKCWDTVSWPDKKVGTIFDLEALNKSEAARRWVRWTPFDNESCRNCKLLPNCAGACAYKFVHADQTRGEAAVLPCPSWKYNIKERLLQRALIAGVVTEAEVDPEAARTDPAELCADVFLGGEALPEQLRPYAEAQKKKRSLPLAPMPA